MIIYISADLTSFWNWASATDAVGEIRKVVKVAVRGSGKTHISEVQIVGDF